jgi:hypothetical protein
MTRCTRLYRLLLVPALLAGLFLGAPLAAFAQEKDPLRATLLESKEKNRGVTLHVQGAAVVMVVTAVEDGHVIGRSQQASRIVVRLDRIDGVSAAF